MYFYTSILGMLARTNKVKKDTSQKMDRYLKGIRKITL
ncbi:hypothetical protein NBRC111894_2292 [Sporolactobacillus inulinus]|uniref:Uncharacterized protein n=1 Tax=Sporolactobacillus inulinus TaxID=2078 RepID=A0A4Y1ZDR6_9BACL|nr:hypothetical protein NBRC111894_2292 [Sporolactobacillus inulinus]